MAAAGTALVVSAAGTAAWAETYRVGNVAAVGTTAADNPDASYVAVANGGTARTDQTGGVAVSTTGTAYGSALAFSGTGCADNSYGAVSASVTGCADGGWLAASGTGSLGPAETSNGRSFVGASGTGCVDNYYVAVSGAGCARSTVAVAGGTANGLVAVGGQGATGPVAVSALGPATADDPFLPGVAVSAAGDADSNAVAVSGTGDARGDVIGISLTDPVR
jgi:hypothetical protein